MLIISFKVADSYANAILTIVRGNIFFVESTFPRGPGSPYVRG